MLSIGPAIKVTIHINEDASSKDGFLYQELLRFLLDRGVAGATVLRVQAGFGARHQLHNAGSAGAEGQHLPARIEFIESKDTVETLLPSLCELVSDGMIETQHTTIVKIATSKSQLP